MFLDDIRNGIVSGLKKLQAGFAPLKDFMDSLDAVGQAAFQAFSAWIDTQPACTPREASSEIMLNDKLDYNEKTFWINFFNSLPHVSGAIYKTLIGKLKGLWVVFLAVAAVILLAPYQALAGGEVTAPDPALVLSWVELVISIAVIAAPIVLALIKLTAWGRANKEALDAVVDSVGKARRMGRPAQAILKTMETKEKTATPNAVRAWKRIVRRVDPKGG